MHISPVHFQFLYFWMRASGFEGVRTHPLPIRRAERLLLSPIAAMLAGMGKVSAIPQRNPLYRELLSLLNSRPLLFSPTLIVTATKSDTQIERPLN
jgi:hypothetical protein